MTCFRWLLLIVLSGLPLGCAEWHGAPPDGGLDGLEDASDGLTGDDADDRTDGADDDGGDEDGGGDGGGDDGGGDDGGGSCIDAYPGQVLITEVMAQPVGASAPAGCYIELYNAGPDELRMIAWQLADDAGGRVDLELPADSGFGPGEYLLLGFEADPLHNGGLEPDLVIAGLDAASDRLRILANGILIDQVDFSQGDWPRVSGAALSLDPSGYDFARNDEPQWWCAAWVAYGAGDLGTPGAQNSACDGTPVCGNTILEAGEQCDDGDDDPCDGCLPDCRLHENFCGDGFACDQEACDDGDDDPCDGCLPDCSLHQNICGDSLRCPPETCDDGNALPGDGCSEICQLESGSCPADMLLVGADAELGLDHDFCLDRFEASRPDATDVDMGSDTSLATSRAGVIPWYVSPASLANLQAFQAACAAAGKRLCSKQEWLVACTGPDHRVYSFGDVFDPQTCNCVDSFCDDYCLEQGIPDCNTAANCGYQYSCFHVVPTGQFPACTTAAGAYDLNGNVWELVPSDDDPRGYEVRGGAFNCAGASTRLQCTFNATWDGLFAGFRCCADL